MIWFLLVAGLLTVAVLAVLLAPMMRRRSGLEDEEPATELFRRQLAAIDEELSEGRLTPEAAEASRTEITRRLLAAADHEAAGSTAPASRGAETAWRFGATIAIAGLLPATAMAVYFAVGTPAAIERHAGANSADPHSTADLAAAVDQIKAHLKTAPDDLKGWTLLGRTLASLGRFPEARDAYNHAIGLAPNDAALHAEFGEVLVLAAQGKVTPAAEAEFAKAPDDPRSRYYAAEAALQQGDPGAAKQKLQALLASAPADAPWRQTVEDRLAELSQNGTDLSKNGEPPKNGGLAKNGNAGPAGDTAGATAPASGPTSQDVAAAQSMTPEQRLTMIRGMVERLAQRLEQHPDDKAGWERLAHAYDVLGEPGKAQMARARAAATVDSAAAPTAAVEDNAATPSAATPSAATPSAATPSAATPSAATPSAATPSVTADSLTGSTASAAQSAPAAPSDARGWIERARAFEGQGRAADALAALKQGNGTFPGNLALLEAYMNALAGNLKDDKPSPEFVAVATQINALDAKQPDALWYLGLAAAQNGDRYRAASYWTKLLAGLPAGDPLRALVQHHLDGLR
ncbi:MAG: c-type cytochrome biogenesis protein CcmI [Stellaceae bacterium]